MVVPFKPWDWPADWFKEFLDIRETSKTYVKVDEFSPTTKKWLISKIFNRYLFWNTIKIEEVSMEILDWLCKDNTKSKWTLSLHLITNSLDSYILIYTFYFKDKSDLLLFKMKW